MKKTWEQLLKEVGLTGKVILELIMERHYQGECFASNAYFAEKTNLSERTITRYIAKFKDLGLITGKMVECKKTKRFLKRRIVPLFTIVEKVKHAQEPIESKVVADAYQETFNQPATKKDVEGLNKLIKNHGEDTVVVMVKQSSAAKARNKIGYIKTTLETAKEILNDKKTPKVAHPVRRREIIPAGFENWQMADGSTVGADTAKEPLTLIDPDLPMRTEELQKKIKQMMQGINLYKN